MSSSLYKNLYKYNWVSVQDQDARVIDNNALLAKRLEGVSSGSMAADTENNGNEPPGGGFTQGLSADELEALCTGDQDEASLIKAQPPEPVYDGPSPEELVAEAKAEAEEILSAARQEAEQLRKTALEEGKKEGREIGYIEGAANAEASLAEKERSLEAKYQDMIEQLEPEFVERLTGIYEYIFHVDLQSYREIVLHLLSGCMQKIEGSRDYIVHVSKEDYPYVSMQKKQLLEEMGSGNATLEIIEDAVLKKNECMIETEGGIFDCSLDVQLEALRKELIMLSYE